MLRPTSYDLSEHEGQNTTGASSITRQSWRHDLIPQDRRGSFFSRRMAWSVGVGMIMNLLAFLGPWTFAVSMAAPFFTVYMLNQVGFSLSMVIPTLISQLVNVGCLPVSGTLADRFSNKSALGNLSFTWFPLH